MTRDEFWAEVQRRMQERFEVFGVETPVSRLDNRTLSLMRIAADVGAEVTREQARVHVG